MDKNKWHDGLFGLVACSTPATISSLASATLYSFEYKRYMDIRQMTEMFPCDASTEDGALKQHISGEDYALISILPACLFYYDVLHNEGTAPVPATAANTKAVLKEAPTSCSDNPTAMSACGGQICNFRRDPRSVAGVTEDEALSLIHDIAATACYSFEVMMHCGYYYFLVKAILEGKQDNLPLANLLSKGIENARNYYTDKSEFSGLKELATTIEAAINCLSTTNTFNDAVQKALSFSNDTETVAALTGGLAGLYYGYQAIPKEFICKIDKADELESSCQKAGDPKFPLGLDINTYKELAFEIIRKQYSWATMDIIENSNFKPGIEILDGYFEYITYSGDNWYYVDYNSGTAAIKWIVDCYRREVVESNKIIDSYEVPFYPHSDEHYHLEKYVFNLLTSGDYSLVQQEGDRYTGGAWTTFLGRDYFANKDDFKEFLSELPRHWNLKEELANDGQAKGFLGFVKRKEHPEVKLVELPYIPVIGDEISKKGYTRDDDLNIFTLPVWTDNVKELWQKVHQMLQSKPSMIKANPDGSAAKRWGVMSGASPCYWNYNPWNYYYREGYYFAGFEVDAEIYDSDNHKDFHSPAGWYSTVIPAGQYAVVDVTDETYEEIYSRYINEIIPEMGMRLSPDRCILDYMEPAAGIKRLYFPVQKFLHIGAHALKENMDQLL